MLIIECDFCKMRGKGREEFTIVTIWKHGNEEGEEDNKVRLKILHFCSTACLQGWIAEASKIKSET